MGVTRRKSTGVGLGRLVVGVLLSAAAAREEVEQPEQRGLRVRGRDRAAKDKDDATEGLKVASNAVDCNALRDVVVVPSVRKGLNNQRMRMVQDIVAAALLGAAVELPAMMNTRVSCANGADCYKDYHRVLPLKHVYDVEKLLGNLRKLGICAHLAPEARRLGDKKKKKKKKEDKRAGSMTETAAPPLPPRPPGWQYPMAASEIAGPGHFDGLALPAGGGRYAFGDVELCCSMLVADTDRALALLQAVNGAFRSAKGVREDALKILTAARKEARQGVIATIHWRADGDFVNSAHGLSVDAYYDAAGQAITFLRDHIWELHPRAMPRDELHILVLGDLTMAQLADIQRIVSSSVTRGPEVTLHSKASFYPNKDWGEVFHGMDDAKGQLDYEVGLISDVFIGSPFSSFSVLLAHQRWYQADNSVAMLDSMVPMDLAGRLGRIFAILFPYTAEDAALAARCTELIAVHGGGYSKSLGACADRERRAQEKSRMVSKLHQVDCLGCGAPDLCPQHGGNLQIIGKSVDGRSDHDTSLVGAAAPLWGCQRTRDAIATDGLLQEPVGGRVYVRGEEEVPGDHVRFFSKAWREHAQWQPAPQNATLDPNAKPRDEASCALVAPNFVFSTPLDDFGETGKVCHVAVVTAVFGDSGRLHGYSGVRGILEDEERQTGISVCFFAFLDSRSYLRLVLKDQRQKARPKHGVWDVIKLPAKMMHFNGADASRNIRLPELLLHRAFLYTPFVVYIDSSLRLETPQRIAALVHGAVAPIHGVTPPAWLAEHHPHLPSVYLEARCAALLGAPVDALLSQMTAYHDDGLPGAPLLQGGPGLVRPGFHIRDLRRPEARLLGCEWFKEFEKSSHAREDLAFNYVAWELQQRRGHLAPVLGYIKPERFGCRVIPEVHQENVTETEDLPMVCTQPSKDATAEKIGALGSKESA